MTHEFKIFVKWLSFNSQWHIAAALGSTILCSVVHHFADSLLAASTPTDIRDAAPKDQTQGAVKMEVAGQNHQDRYDAANFPSEDIFTKSFVTFLCLLHENKLANSKISPFIETPTLISRKHSVPHAHYSGILTSPFPSP